MQGLCHIAAVSIDTNMVRPKSGMFTRFGLLLDLSIDFCQLPMTLQGQFDRV
jgi:hypothetical protein